MRFKKSTEMLSIFTSARGRISHPRAHNRILSGANKPLKPLHLWAVQEVAGYYSKYQWYYGKVERSEA